MWKQHLQEYRIKHPSKTLCSCMKEASKTYRAKKRYRAASFSLDDAKDQERKNRRKSQFDSEELFPGSKVRVSETGEDGFVEEINPAWIKVNFGGQIKNIRKKQLEKMKGSRVSDRHQATAIPTYKSRNSLEKGANVGRLEGDLITFPNPQNNNKAREVLVSATTDEDERGPLYENLYLTFLPLEWAKKLPAEWAERKKLLSDEKEIFQRHVRYDDIQADAEDDNFIRTHEKKLLRAGFAYIRVPLKKGELSWRFVDISAIQARPNGRQLTLRFSNKYSMALSSSDIAARFYNYKAVLRSLSPSIEQLSNGEFQAVQELSDDSD